MTVWKILLCILCIFLFLFVDYYHFVFPKESKEKIKEKNYTNEIYNLPFFECFSEDGRNCSIINYPIFDKKTHKLLLDPKTGQRYTLPNINMIPRKGKKLGYCGYGHLLFNKNSWKWSCYCMIPELFGGEMCDKVQPQMINNFNCLEVADVSNPLNKDISTFNPIIDGICSKCKSPETQSPVSNADIPQCAEKL